MAYATTSDMTTRYDTGILGDYVTDDGDRVLPGSLPNHPILVAMLDDASGWIDSAALAGNRYQVSDLASMTGPGKALLVRLTCDIAFFLLAQRRPTKDLEKDLPMHDKALDMLEKLRHGDRIFNIDTAKAAGVAKSEALDPIALRRSGLFSMNSRYFPVRYR